METQYNGNSGKAGIYQIRNLNNGRVYIGSAKEFKSRYKSHIKSLEKGTHHNKHLQSAFNLERTDAFIFEVLEVVEGEQSDRLFVEQKHLDSYNSNWDSCYNFKQQAKADSRSCFSKDPEKTREKRSESAKKMWADEEYRKNQSDSGKQTTTACWKSEEHRARVTESIKQFWSSEQSSEIKQRASKRMSERVISDETRNKISKSVSLANKILWQDPEYRKKVLEGRKRAQQARIVSKER